MLRQTTAKASPAVPVPLNRLIPRLPALPFFVSQNLLRCVFSIFSVACVFADEGYSQPLSKVAVRVTKRNEGSTIRFFVENMEKVQVTATFEPGLMNMRGSRAFPCTLALLPGSVTEVFSLTPLANDSKWAYTLTNFFALGDFRAVHSDSHLYELPFDAGKKARQILALRCL